MTADPNEPDSFEDDADAATERDIEAPVTDAAEQHHELSPQHDDPMTGTDLGSATEADRAEQARVVEQNEDEYR
ncbi:hypothetical protein ACQUSR_10855 [Streptomyces sp. P1-3]|uniref:hypothetical protein n=1 Tax=Streptomyces sp. P1-3 TaxID=3421658 RepID=UPI003D35B51E